jgi:hypothetical protein
MLSTIFPVVLTTVTERVIALVVYVVVRLALQARAAHVLPVQMNAATMDDVMLAHASVMMITSV